MARKPIVVNLNRCIGCWTCSLACKSVNKLEDDDFRITVRTHGNGQGIDHPQGQWPDLRMSWQPIWTPSCTDCGKRQAEGKGPFCVECCPTKALFYAEDADAEESRLREDGFEIFELPSYEGSRDNVVYARKAVPRF